MTVVSPCWATIHKTIQHASDHLAIELSRCGVLCTFKLQGTSSRLSEACACAHPLWWPVRDSQKLYVPWESGNKHRHMYILTMTRHELVKKDKVRFVQNNLALVFLKSSINDRPVVIIRSCGIRETWSAITSVSYYEKLQNFQYPLVGYVF